MVKEDMDKQKEDMEKEKMEKENTEKEDEEQQFTEKKFLCMDVEMIPCKLLFFTMDIAFSCCFAFISLFYISQGLSIAKLGIASSIASVVSMVSGPIWGSIVDSLKNKWRYVFVTVMGLLSTGVVIAKPFAILFIPMRVEVTTCVNSTIFNSSVFNSSQIERNCTTHLKLLNENSLFIVITCANTLTYLMFHGMFCYVEAVILKTVYTRKKEYSYGEQKVFGPIGSALGALIAGLAVDHYHPKNPRLSPYLAPFYIYVPLSVLMLPLLWILTWQANWDYGKQKKHEKKLTMFQHLKNACKKNENVMYLVSLMVLGLAGDVYYDYLLVYIYKFMHPSHSMLSLNQIITNMISILVYPFTTKLMKAFGGPMRCIILGGMATFVRLIVASYSTQYYQILIVQGLNGMVRALSRSAQMEYTWTIFPKEITTTALGIVWIFDGVAGIIARIGGGFIFQLIGGAKLFRITGMIIGTWIIFMLVYFEIINKKKSPKEDDDLDENNKEEIGIEMQDESRDKKEIDLEKVCGEPQNEVKQVPFKGLGEFVVSGVVEGHDEDVQRDIVDLNKIELQDETMKLEFNENENGAGNVDDEPKPETYDASDIKINKYASTNNNLDNIGYEDEGDVSTQC